MFFIQIFNKFWFKLRYHIYRFTFLIFIKLILRYLFYLNDWNSLLILYIFFVFSYTSLALLYCLYIAMPEILGWLWRHPQYHHLSHSLVVTRLKCEWWDGASNAIVASDWKTKYFLNGWHSYVFPKKQLNANKVVNQLRRLPCTSLIGRDSKTVSEWLNIFKINIIQKTLYNC